MVLQSTVAMKGKPPVADHPCKDKAKDTDPRYSIQDAITGQWTRYRDDKGRCLPGKREIMMGKAALRPGPGRPKPDSARGKQLRKIESEKFGRLIREVLRERTMVQFSRGEKVEMTWRAAMIHRLSAMAAEGNLPAMKMLLEYGYGPPPQRTEISGPDGSALRVTFPQAFEGV